MKLLHVVTFLLMTATFSYGQKNLVMVGGGLSDTNDAIWNEVVNLAGGQGVARIGVVTAASADPWDSWLYYEDQFVNKYGAASAYWVPVTVDSKEMNSDPDVVANIHQQTGFFFGGGDQSRVVESFFLENRVDSPALVAIKEEYDAGAVVGGTSAGTACMSSSVMVTGGLSWSGLVNGACACDIHPDDPLDGLTYDQDGGLGMIDKVILDSHFSERGREGRLIRLLADTKDQSRGTMLGIGMDENTALVIYGVGTNSQRGVAIGEHGVFIAELYNAVIGTNPNDFNIRYVNTHYITEKDEYDFIGGKVTYAPYKKNLIGDEMYQNAITSTNIFSHPDRTPRQYGEYKRIAINLFDSREDDYTCGCSFMSNPYYYVDYFQMSKSTSYHEYHPTYGHHQISYADMDIDIFRTPHSNCPL
ncbi:cyanophycinase-like [Glandiceps talaboti]